MPPNLYSQHMWSSSSTTTHTRTLLTSVREPPRFANHVDHFMKRTSLAHSSQDHTPLHTFMLYRAALYKKPHHRLSLSSFPSVSSRKDCRVKLVSFMLVKVSEWSSSQYRFNLFWPDWTTNGKEVSHPLQDGRALLCILIYFFGHMRLPTIKSPHWSLLRAFRLSKIENTIEHLLSRLSKNPWDRTLLGPCWDLN